MVPGSTKVCYTYLVSTHRQRWSMKPLIGCIGIILAHQMQSVLAKLNVLQFTLSTLASKVIDSTSLSECHGCSISFWTNSSVYVCNRDSLLWIEVAICIKKRSQGGWIPRLYTRSSRLDLFLNSPLLCKRWQFIEALRNQMQRSVRVVGACVDLWLVSCCWLNMGASVSCNG